MPKRIQLSRKKGWKMPPNTVKVDRTTKWGNPFTVDHWEFKTAENADLYWCCCARESHMVVDRFPTKEQATQKSIEMYRELMKCDSLKWLDFLWKWSISEESTTRSITYLRGKDLACWCKIGEPCHADILIELANQ